MDTLFKNITAVTLDSANTVLHDAYIGVKAGKVAYIGAEPPEGEVQTVIDGTHKVLMPGIVNAHTHLPMTLLRGYADDVDLHTWLFDHIFPAEERLTGKSVYLGTMLALMECIAAGTVSVTDMYFYSADIARALAESGLKGNICRPFQGEGDQTVRMREAVELAEQYHRHDNGRILVDASIHAEYTSSPAVWELVAQFAQDRGLQMHTHISETAREHIECVERYGKTPAAILQQHGLFSVPVTAAHCVHVTDDDITILASHGVTAVHCPVSNLKLGSGIARVRAMLANGVNVALGTDGAASNNSLDMFEEMKIAAVLEPGHEAESGFMLGAAGALRLATRNGALSQGRRSGQIVEGLDADLIMLDFDRPHLAPLHNPVSSLVYSARGSDVVLTMVNGKVIYRDGEYMTLDREKVMYEARLAGRIFRWD